ncbi:MAG: hypothetical protein PHO37_17420 [Kiritimatiellae bacterium]|nr:hypothetical protein [Kiritimatiellia bacterium]
MAGKPGARKITVTDPQGNQTVKSGTRRIYIRESGDDFSNLAKLLKLDLDEIHKWVKIADDSLTADRKRPCKVSVPNVMEDSDVFRCP